MLVPPRHIDISRWWCFWKSWIHSDIILWSLVPGKRNMRKGKEQNYYRDWIYTEWVLFQTVHTQMYIYLPSDVTASKKVFIEFLQTSGWVDIIECDGHSCNCNEGKNQSECQFPTTGLSSLRRTVCTVQQTNIQLTNPRFQHKMALTTGHKPITCPGKIQKPITNHMDILNVICYCYWSRFRSYCKYLSARAYAENMLS